MTTQLGYDDAYDRDANLGDALIDGEDPEDLLIERRTSAFTYSRRVTSSRTSRRG